MPRVARLDAAGVLHHVIFRGIERRKIFRRTADKDWFVLRLGQVLSAGTASCYAWSLMDNHVHLLLRTGDVSLATLMRRLPKKGTVLFIDISGHILLVCKWNESV